MFLIFERWDQDFLAKGQKYYTVEDKMNEFDTQFDR